MTDARPVYSFEQCLGKGGFGEVYLAIRRSATEGDKRVAIKILREDADEDAMKRLRDEGRMLSLLDHPNIVAVDHTTRIDGRIALVMEAVDGVALSHYSSPGLQMPARVVAEIGMRIAAALQAAYSAPSPETGRPLRIIHRDIKPGNIIVGAEGQVKLLDFGIAHTSEIGRHASTDVNHVNLTPGYAAPECLTHGTHSHASDIYALGACLYRLLRTEELFVDLGIYDQMARVMRPEEYQRWLSKRCALLPEALSPIFVRILAHAPSARPTAAEVSLLLSAVAPSLDGASLKIWGGTTSFPPPSALLNAALVGKVLPEEGGATLPMASPVQSFGHGLGGGDTRPPHATRSVYPRTQAQRRTGRHPNPGQRPSNPAAAAAAGRTHTTGSASSSRRDARPARRDADPQPTVRPDHTAKAP